MSDQQLKQVAAWRIGVAVVSFGVVAVFLPTLVYLVACASQTGGCP